MAFDTRRVITHIHYTTPARFLIVCYLSILFPLLEPDRVYAKSHARLTSAAHSTLNATAAAVDALEPPLFSHTGGFYSSPFQLALSTAQEDASIYYTLDGSESSAGALRYEGPIVIESRAGDPNVLSLIRTTVPEVFWFEPAEAVFKATVIRARLVANGEVGPIATHTYIVDPAGAERFSLPVVSLVSNSANFFDPDIGIYVPGNGYDGVDRASANYAQSGRDWERPVHIELFLENGTRVLAQDAGVRTHGGNTRVYQAKSLRFYARGDYGPTSFKAQLFPDRPFTEYDTFILRNAGNDWNLAHFRDGLIHRLVDHLKLDVQAFRPVVVFLNGEYWGIHNLRERQDAEYLKTHYGIPTNAVDMLELPSEISEGSDAHYRAMIQYVDRNNLAEPEAYAYLETQMDIDNFIDYNIVEIFSSNTDWPHNNVENWRYQADAYTPDAAYGFDGRWRWFVKDLDFGFNGFDRSGSYDRDMLSWATAPDGNGNGAWSTKLLRALMQNETFRHKFINRFADHLNTAFVPERVLALVDEIAGALAPEMPQHIRRYGQPATLNHWQNEIALIREFAQERPQYQRQHIVDFFELGGVVNVELNVSHPAAGAIRINSLLINQETVGVTGQPYPWQGIYFQGVPVQITAVPNFGYRFAGWEGAHAEPLGETESLELLLTQDLDLTARFEADPEIKTSYLPQITRRQGVQD